MQEKIRYPFVTLDEVLHSGMTGSQLRATANSLERIAEKGYDAWVQEPNGSDYYTREKDSAMNPGKCIALARHLRRLSKQADPHFEASNSNVSE